MEFIELEHDNRVRHALSAFPMAPRCRFDAKGVVEVFLTQIERHPGRFKAIANYYQVLIVSCFFHVVSTKCIISKGVLPSQWGIIWLIRI